MASASSSRVALFVLIALALVVVAYWGGLENLVFRWIEREEYSHGFFIPLIALWMLWRRRDAISQSVGPPSAWGLLVLSAAMGLLFIGEISAIYILIQFSFVLCLMVLVMTFGGFSLLRVCFVPLFLLFFAIPMPYFIDAQLSWWLQLVSSRLGVEMLRLGGVPVHLEGNMIDLGLYKLQVADACSGLRYLYPLLSLGFLAAYMFTAPLWQKVLVFVAVIPITISMNSFRIAAIGAAVNIWGIEMAEGFLHFFEGWVIFMGCAALLLLMMWLLDRLGKRRALSEVLVLPDVQPVIPGAPTGVVWPAITALVVLLAVVIGVHSLDQRDEVIPQRLQLSSFPLALGVWTGREQFLEVPIEETLGTDDYLLVDYHHRTGKQVNVWVAYYASQRKGNSPHSPRVCLPGGGWRIDDLSTVQYQPADGGAAFPVNRAVMSHGESKQLVYYWLEQRGRRIADEYWAKWYLLLDSIVMNRSDGALVRLVTPVYSGEDMASADQRILVLVDAMLPIIPDYVPNQGKVPR